MRSGIYFILNTVSLKLYIGSAVYFARRRSEHFTRLAKGIHHNEHLQRAYNKYGPDAFDFIIIELVSLDKLIERETYYIAKHKTTEEEFGYNKCPFGVSSIGRKHSEETKAKMSASQKGKTLSEEAKAKVGAASKGRKWSIETRLKILSKGRSEESKRKTSETMKARFIGENAATNKAKMTKAANTRWALELTQAPIIMKDLI